MIKLINDLISYIMYLFLKIHCFYLGVVSCCYYSMADGISFDVSLSLNGTDLYKRGGGA